MKEAGFSFAPNPLFSRLIGRMIYSPLHRVGTSTVCPALEGVGFDDVEVFGPHAPPYVFRP